MKSESEAVSLEIALSPDLGTGKRPATTWLSLSMGSERSILCRLTANKLKGEQEKGSKDVEHIVEDCGSEGSFQGVIIAPEE